MKLFSKSSQHAIRALMHVLETDSLPCFSIKEVCNQAGIPEAFTRKALQEMAKAGIVKGISGPGGGYQLLREPSEISLLDIVLAVDGQYAFAECPMGLRCQSQLAEGAFLVCDTCTFPDPKCGLNHICPLHNLWRETRKMVIRQLEHTTLHDIKTTLAEHPV